MEKPFYKILIAAALLLSATLFSCKKDSADEAAKEPSVAIEVTHIGSDNALFTITVKDASAAYFLTLESDMTEPTDEMLTGIGTPLAKGENRDLAADGLTASTSYTVYALAVGADGRTARAQSEFTTISGTEEGVLKATTAMGIYYGCKFSKDAANYYFMLTDCPFQHGMAQGAGTMVYFDCYGPVSDKPQQAVIPTGKYLFENSVTHDQFRISSESTVLLAVGNDGNITENSYF